MPAAFPQPRPDVRQDVVIAADAVSVGLSRQVAAGEDGGEEGAVLGVQAGTVHRGEEGAGVQAGVPDGGEDRAAALPGHPQGPHSQALPRLQAVPAGQGAADSQARAYFQADSQSSQVPRPSAHLLQRLQGQWIRTTRTLGYRS